MHNMGLTSTTDYTVSEKANMVYSGQLEYKSLWFVMSYKVLLVPKLDQNVHSLMISESTLYICGF